MTAIFQVKSSLSSTRKSEPDIAVERNGWDKNARFIICESNNIALLDRTIALLRRLKPGGVVAAFVVVLVNLELQLFA